MARTATDDLDLLATRLRLGIPLVGFDGRAIPLRHADGSEVEIVDAARRLLESGADLLPPGEADGYLERAIGRARGVEASSIIAGDDTALAVAKVTAVLVSAAIRAAVLARAAHASPGDLNHATLAWYEIHDRRRQDLLTATDGLLGERLTA